MYIFNLLCKMDKQLKLTMFLLKVINSVKYALFHSMSSS